MTEMEPTSTKTEVALVTAPDGDWTGFYVNGILQLENHSLNAREVLMILDRLGLITLLLQSCDQEWLEDEGELPLKLTDVR